MEPIQTILSDPPWKYSDLVHRARVLQAQAVGFGADMIRGRRGAAGYYPTMTVGEIIALREGGERRSVRPLTIAGFEIAENAHLYLWTTNAFMVEAHDVARSWGFQQRTILTWVKPGIGMGHYWRGATEHVLFCVRGSLRTKRRDCRTWFTGPNARHSQKPQSFYPLVESQSPGPYLELFARRSRPGWTSWGLPEEAVSPRIVE